MCVCVCVCELQRAFCFAYTVKSKKETRKHQGTQKLFLPDWVCLAACWRKICRQSLGILMKSLALLLRWVGLHSLYLPVCELHTVCLLLSWAGVLKLQKCNLVYPISNVCSQNKTFDDICSESCCQRNMCTCVCMFCNYWVGCTYHNNISPCEV